MRPLSQTEKQWLFPAEALHQTISQEQGMTYELELQRRAETISHIRSLAFRTGLSQDEDLGYNNGGNAKGVLTVAAILIHRFYMRRSINDFPPELMAPTILFIASKIEEEPVKLRYLVNSCQLKFDNASQDKLWNPVGEHPSNPSKEYQRWEQEILAAEEIAHEALCFDMIVDQPWPILFRAITGLDTMWIDPDGPPTFREPDIDTPPIPLNVNEDEEGELPESSQDAVKRNGVNGVGSKKGKGKMTESIIMTTAWTIMNQLYLLPISIMYPAEIIAFATFKIVVRHLLPDDDTILISLNELAHRFGLDNSARAETDKAEKSDMELVDECMEQIAVFETLDIRIKGLPILRGIVKWLAPPPDDPPLQIAPRFSTQAVQIAS